MITMTNAKKIRSEMAEQAVQRSNIYGFLAAVYRKELTAELLRQIRDPHFMGVLFDLGVSLSEEFFSSSESLVEDLAVEYGQLFLGPDRHISPHESVHHERDDGDWGQLWGADTVAVKKFIESTGIEYASHFSDMPDHISVELEFMQAVIEEESKAWRNNDIKRVNHCCQLEKKFMEEHLSQWIHVFCDKVEAQAIMPFYREIASITRNFINLEKEELESLCT
jgi:TorA maturation chaperone TorD